MLSALIGKKAAGLLLPALPWLGVAAAIAGAALYVMDVEGALEREQGLVAAAVERAETAERLNRDLAAEMDRARAERVRMEAALAAERDAALARAAAVARARQQIREAPDAAAPVSPAIGDALRRLYLDLGSGPGAAP